MKLRLLLTDNNIKTYNNSFIYSFCCLSYDRSTVPSKASSPQMWSSASSFNFQYSVFSLRSYSSFVRLLHLPITYILPPVFPATCLRRQFLSSMWPIQLAFLLFVVCRIFLSSLTLCNTSPFVTRSVQLIFSIHLQCHISKLSKHFLTTSQTVPVSTPHKAVPQMWHFTGCFL